VASATPWSLYPRERAQAAILKEAGWPKGWVWRKGKTLSFPEIQTPDHPAFSKLLYQLHYPSPWERQKSK